MGGENNLNGKTVIGSLMKPETDVHIVIIIRGSNHGIKNCVWL